MLRVILLICCVLLSGCRADEINVGSLTEQDRALFKIAADKEGVLIVGKPYPVVWGVKRGSLPKDTQGQVLQSKFGTCEITIRHDLKACPNGGVDQRFIMVARHEIRHCQGEGHSEYPDDLMYKNAPCELKEE